MQQGKINEFIRTLSKFEVISLDSRQVDLEEIFMHYYKTRGEGGEG